MLVAVRKRRTPHPVRTIGFNPYKYTYMYVDVNCPWTSNIIPDTHILDASPSTPSCLLSLYRSVINKLLISVDFPSPDSPKKTESQIIRHVICFICDALVMKDICNLIWSFFEQLVAVSEKATTVAFVHRSITVCFELSALFPLSVQDMNLFHIQIHQPYQSITYISYIYFKVSETDGCLTTTI